MFKIRRFIHVSYSKNCDWKPVISQTLTSVQEIFLVMWILTVPTPLDRMYVHASLDTLEMDELAQVILIIFLQSQLFKAKSNLKRPFNSYYGARSSQTFILKCSSTPLFTLIRNGGLFYLVLHLLRIGLQYFVLSWNVPCQC